MEQSRRNNLFFIELILSIFFFIICATICVQLFVHAHLLNEQSTDTNHALLLSQNVAEIFLGNQGNIHALKDFFHESDVSTDYISTSSDDTILLFYDDVQASPVIRISEAKYGVLLKNEVTDGMSHADIYVFKASDWQAVYDNTENLKTYALRTLSVDKYVGKE